MIEQYDFDLILDSLPSFMNDDLRSSLISFISSVDLFVSSFEDFCRSFSSDSNS